MWTYQNFNLKYFHKTFKKWAFNFSCFIWPLRTQCNTCSFFLCYSLLQSISNITQKSSSSLLLKCLSRIRDALQCGLLIPNIQFIGQICCQCSCHMATVMLSEQRLWFYTAHSSYCLAIWGNYFGHLTNKIRNGTQGVAFYTLYVNIITNENK